MKLNLMKYIEGILYLKTIAGVSFDTLLLRFFFCLPELSYIHHFVSNI